ncbi:MAG TPA: ABC transporter substrate-binding protein [Acidimicrobiales bacterium]|nr:ABC transporter substrate-binding protein [Acidimicrobiales bacterium]
MAAKRWVVVAVTCLVLATACGARVDPLPESGGLSAGAASQQSGTAETTTTLAGDTGTDGGTATTTPSGNQSTNTVPGQAAPKSFNYTAAGEAAACTGTNGNTASDVGITPTEIRVGNVSGLTGVITNSFNQGPEAVQALFDDVNAHGGICGRKLKLVVQDDGEDAARNEANHRDLATKVFTFVGSTSNADNAGVQAMVERNVPDIGFAINENRGQSKVFWSAAGSTLYKQNGKYTAYNTVENGLKANNAFPKRIAALAYSIPISSDAAKQFAYRYQQAGAEICYTDYGIQPGASYSLDSQVLQMKRNNCDGVFTTMDVSGNTKLLQAEQRQNFHPLTMVTFASYTPDQIAVAGEAAAQGLQITINWIPFNEPNPIMQIYLDQLKTYQPGKRPSSFGVLAWAAGQMFVQGLIAAGRNPTRATLVKFFESLENYDTGGILTPVTPRTRRPVGPCIVQVEAKGGEFVRKWPSSGFYCTSKLVPSEP